jgi:hypothetical protein
LNDTEQACSVFLDIESLICDSTSSGGELDLLALFHIEELLHLRPEVLA